MGKTELAKALAQFLFGREDAMIRLDMTEYAEAHTISRLLGAPPGYVGYDNGGQLTEAVRRNAYTVILLDEMDKAHDDVCDLLLQILDEGRLTDTRGRVVNFRQSLIIMTCNIEPDVRQHIPMRFTSGATPTEEEYYRRNVEDMDRLLRARFRPELLNRVDARIFFNPLDMTSLKLIAKNQIALLADQLAEEGWVLSVAPELVDFIVQKSLKTTFGAREVVRAVRQEIAQPLSEIILRGEISPGAILAELKEERAHFRRLDG